MDVSTTYDDRMETWTPEPRRGPKGGVTNDDVTPDELARAMGLLPEQLNDVVSLLSESDLQETKRRVKKARDLRSLEQWKEDSK